MAVWPGKSNPEDEVVSVQLLRFDGVESIVGDVSLGSVFARLLTTVVSIGGAIPEIQRRS